MHAQPFQDCVDWHCYGCGRLNDHGLQIKSPGMGATPAWLIFNLLGCTLGRAFLEGWYER
jgi:hypothetical protein